METLLRQRHEGFVTPRPAPAVALNASDQPLAVVLDLDERAMAIRAGVLCHFVSKVRESGRPFCADIGA